MSVKEKTSGQKTWRKRLCVLVYILIPIAIVASVIAVLVVTKSNNNAAPSNNSTNNNTAPNNNTPNASFRTEDCSCGYFDNTSNTLWTDRIAIDFTKIKSMSDQPYFKITNSSRLSERQAPYGRCMFHIFFKIYSYLYKLI